MRCSPMGLCRRHHWPPVAAGVTAATLAPWMSAMAQSAGQGPVVAIEWIASDSNQCPDAAYVAARTARLLDGATADAPRLRARALVAHDESGPWRVDLSTESAAGTGHRSVAAESCRAAADATALILALAVDAEGAATDAGADSTPGKTAPTTLAAIAGPVPATSSSRETPVPPPDRSPSKIFSAGVYALADLGTLPRIAPGGGIRLGATPPFAPAVRLELGASLWVPQTVSPAAPSLSSRFDLRSFEVAACWTPSLGRWELGACVGGELGWITASGTSSGTGVGRSSDALWPILRGGITGAFRLGARWAIRADLGLGVSLDRPEFRWEGVGAGTAQSPAVVAARAAVGLEVRF